MSLRVVLALLLCLAFTAGPASTARADDLANDEASGAVLLNGLPAQVSVDSRAATSGADEDALQCNGVSSEHTLWYRVTASSDTEFSAYAYGYDEGNYYYGEVDTTLTVATGTPGTLSFVACNDDYNNYYLSSQVNWNAVAGQTYYVMLGTKGQGGDMTLFVDEPYNIHATLAPTGSFSLVGKTAEVSGTVTCNEPSLIEVWGELTQTRPGELGTVGQVDHTIDCDGETPFTLTFVPGERRFLLGNAVATIYLDGCAIEYYYYECDDTVFEGPVDLDMPAV